MDMLGAEGVPVPVPGGGWHGAQSYKRGNTRVRPNTMAAGGWINGRWWANILAGRSGRISKNALNVLLEARGPLRRVWFCSAGSPRRDPTDG